MPLAPTACDSADDPDDTAMMDCGGAFDFFPACAEDIGFGRGARSSDSDDEADDECAGEAAAGHPHLTRKRSTPAAAGPRRLSLQQRRRLNLYSKLSACPAPQLPSLAYPPAQGPAAKQQPQQQQQAAQHHDTPTIQEEDSGFGSVASPVDIHDAPDGDVEMPARRGRTVSDAATEDEAAGGPKKPAGALSGRLRTLSHSHAGGAGSPTSKWPRALNLVFQNLKNDAWRDMAVAKMPEEAAVRHRYNPHKRQWIHDRVRVRIEADAFNRGAMRECFRLKKLSGFSRFESWHSRACNYVAKRYIEGVDREVYFEDVRVQMNAKLWAQEYNRHQPPKKVDIMQMYVIEFTEREGSPLYHLEHHIEGDYVKHNSNSGFVDDNARRTPHALSHFTFERSGHQLIVVDIQGVDDIYTDPQIHTAEGTEYGDGNLGVRGMALFFSTHVCNEICQRLGLSRFDMAPSEISQPPSPLVSGVTCVRADVFAIGSPMSPPCSLLDSAVGSSFEEDDALDSSSSGGGGGNRRRRTTSSDEMTPEEELAALSAALKRRERPSCVQGNLHLAMLSGGGGRGGGGRVNHSRSDSGSESRCGGYADHQPLPGMPEVRCRGPILGRIHHELARLHDAGRLVSAPSDAGNPHEEMEPGQLEDKINWPAAVFHEQLAAKLDVVEAAINLARLHLGLPTDCLQAAARRATILPNSVEGHRYMEAAARLGDRSAMLYLAKAHDTGNSPGLEKDWDRAAHFYQRALATTGQTDREGGYDSLDTPGYLLRARLAELYLRGGYGLDSDPATSAECYGEAAEEAMAEGNGKLAAKYYALAEEASAMVPEDE